MPKVTPSKSRKDPPPDAVAGFSHNRALPERLRQYDQSRQLISQSLGPLTMQQGGGRTVADSPIASFSGRSSSHDAKSEDFDSFVSNMNEPKAESVVEYNSPRVEKDSHDLSQKDPLSLTPEFLEQHDRASSRDRRTLVDESIFEHRPPPTPRRSRSHLAAEPSDVFDCSEFVESTSSGSEAPSLGPDPNGEGFGFLPCEFVGYSHCDFQYNLADTEQWMKHIMGDHLGWRLPEICACWYCDDFVFDTRENGLDAISNFRERLYHIRDHITQGNCGMSDIRPDYNFLVHLREHRIISQSMCDIALSYKEGPQSDVDGIYPHDFVPPERQYKEDRSASLVVSESSREGRRKGRRHRRRNEDRPTLGKIEEQSITSLPDPVTSTTRKDAGLNTSYRTIQRTSDPYLSSPNNTLSIEKKPRILHKVDAPSDADTPKHQKLVVAESSKSRLKALKSEQLSTQCSIDSFGDFFSNHQERSKLDQTPQHEDQNKLYLASSTLKELSIASPPYHEPPTRDRGDKFSESHSDSYPSSLSSLSSVVRTPSILDEIDTSHDANTLMHQREALAESSQFRLKAPKSLQLSPSSMNKHLGNPERQSTSNRIPHSRPIQSPEPSDVTASEPSTSDQEGRAVRSPSSTRQVGLVRVRIERLSIFDHCVAYLDPSDDLDEEADVTEDEHGEDVTELESGSTDHQEPGESSSTSPKESRSSSKRLNTDTTNPAREEGSDREQNVRRNGPDRKRKKTVCTEQTVRFACPYQAFDNFKDCLKPGRRNPKGGCTGLNRLKQHLSRRHMESYRCQRCWGVFDSRLKASEHEAQETQCSSREKPPNENFMTHEQEAEIETVCRSVSAEGAWWNLFRLLIPGMQDQDIMSLMPRYCPYYINRHSNFTIPSLTVSNISFEPTPQATSNVQDAMHNTTSAVPDPSSSHDLTFNIPSTPIEIQPEGSQTVTIPLLQVLDSAVADNDFSNFPRTTGIGTSNQLNLDSGSSSSSDNFATSLTPGTAFEASGLPEISLNNQAQQTRNHERLRDRNRQSEATIAALRGTMHGTLVDLNHADTLVEDMFSLGNLTDVMYDKLESLSSVLGSARKKLQ